jgi:hypothetical protein
MSYDLPGKVELDASATVREAWNEQVAKNYAALQQFHSRFFELDYQALKHPQRAELSWFGDPAEPAFCLGATVAQQLADWGTRGRHATHNEYCEYAVVYGVDTNGRRRPKRVQVTTELREYWVTLAVNDPELLQRTAASILGRVPTMMELYGEDPMTLGHDERLRAFSKQTAGSGDASKAPLDPSGPLNTDNALFMSHPINGLDDLLYIVLYGSVAPRAVQVDGKLVPATKEAIFRADQVEHLACRHADPAAAMGAQGLAWSGRIVAFGNPLGMYIRSFSRALFTLNGAALPDEWIRWSRGSEAGMYQRLEFGPPDTDPHFLDDILLESPGAPAPVPVTGGFQVVRNIEVGPLLVHGEGTAPKPNEIVQVEPVSAISCGQAAVCKTMRALKEEYDKQPPATLTTIQQERLGF